MILFVQRSVGKAFYYLSRRLKFPPINKSIVGKSKLIRRDPIFAAATRHVSLQTGQIGLNGTFLTPLYPLFPCSLFHLGLYLSNAQPCLIPSLERAS
ncbi:hypothetical protein L249_0166 [Ophiocordyceps polyrhachis-furcata BCC 54312]|uniref:Uncharacterized protein n=1 Tax=Ophiocordyceps polyrhachis-furcata BCC 54312 TaxID=1330021 RepID=A0A367LEK3_9HYPO|nr:hypothetical protein L249_0166 [Ophiocordyceps polyrhachis-furcata BCC 54312]